MQASNNRSFLTSCSNDGCKSCGAFRFLDYKTCDISSILENSKEPDVQHKAELLSHEWERAVFTVNRRKRQLAQMVDDSRDWDTIRTQARHCLW